MKKTLIIIISTILCLQFIYSIFELVSLRFLQGDNYPKYSSFRADPLGMKGLYDSLGELENIKVMRSLQHIKDTKLPYSDSILFATGIGSDKDDWKNDKEYYNYVLNGGRLIIIFSLNAKGAYTYKNKDNKEVDEEQEYCKFGFAVERSKKMTSAKFYANLADAEFAEKFNIKKLSFYTKNHLLLSPEYDWRTLYEYEKSSMVIERNAGKGSLIVSTMSYCLTNEGLQKDMPVEFITYLLQNRKLVVFDEFIHGLQEKKILRGSQKNII